MKGQSLFTAQQFLRFRVRNGKQELQIKWAGYSGFTWEPIRNVLCATQQQIETFRDTYKNKIKQYAQIAINEKEIQIINPQAQNYVELQLNLDQEYKQKWAKSSKSARRSQISSIQYCELDPKNLRKCKKIGKWDVNQKKVHKKGNKQIKFPEQANPLHVQIQKLNQNQIIPQTLDEYTPKRIKLNFEKENLQQLKKQCVVQKYIRQDDGWIDEQIGEINEYVKEEQYKSPIELLHLNKLISKVSRIKQRFLAKNDEKYYSLQFNEKCFQWPIIIHQKYIQNFRPELLAQFFAKQLKQLD